MATARAGSCELKRLQMAGKTACGRAGGAPHCNQVSAMPLQQPTATTLFSMHPVTPPRFVVW